MKTLFLLYGRSTFLSAVVVYGVLHWDDMAARVYTAYFGALLVVGAAQSADGLWCARPRWQGALTPMERGTIAPTVYPFILIAALLACASLLGAL